MTATTFLAAIDRDHPRAAEARVAILGVPWDGAVTYRAGASAGPVEIRRASVSIETWCPKTRGDLEDRLVLDLDDVDLDGVRDPAVLVERVRARLAAAGGLPVLGLGGDHLVALPFVTRVLEQHPDCAIFHVDAHTDLRDTWEGEKLNHATVIRRVLEAMSPRARLFSWGIRSGLREEFELAEADPRIELVAPTREAGLALARSLAAEGRPVYLTIDVDGIDPADIPGTGTPEPDGLRFGWVEDAIVELGRGRLLGADLVELAPGLDPTGRSCVAVARLARALLLALHRTP
jgi:agmatinase